jgi:hypothetical protein
VKYTVVIFSVFLTFFSLNVMSQVFVNDEFVIDGLDDQINLRSINGGYYCYGSAQELDGDLSDFEYLLVKLDPNYDTVWTIYDTAAFDPYFVEHDSSFVLVYSNMISDQSYITKVDHFGNILWQTVADSIYSVNFFDADTNYYLIGTPFSSNQTYINKINLNGTVEAGVRLDNHNIVPRVRYSDSSILGHWGTELSLLKFNGDTIWTVEVENGIGASSISEITVNKDDDIFITLVNRQHADSSGIQVIKVSPTGQILENKIISLEPSFDDWSLQSSIVAIGNEIWVVVKCDPVWQTGPARHYAVFSFTSNLSLFSAVFYEIPQNEVSSLRAWKSQDDKDALEINYVCFETGSWKVGNTRINGSISAQCNILNIFDSVFVFNDITVENYISPASILNLAIPNYVVGTTTWQRGLELVRTEDCLVIGVDEQRKRQVALVYPNPSSTSLNLDLDVRFDYYLYNISGSLVLKGNSLRTIDIGSLTNGLYLLQISAGDKISNYKIIKQ